VQLSKNDKQTEMRSALDHGEHHKPRSQVSETDCREYNALFRHTFCTLRSFCIAVRYLFTNAVGEDAVWNLYMEAAQ